MSSRVGQCLPSAPSLRTNEIYKDMDPARILQAFNGFLLDCKRLNVRFKSGVPDDTTRQRCDGGGSAWRSTADKWTKVLVRGNRRTCWWVT
jgi:hypothetical protein